MAKATAQIEITASSSRLGAGLAAAAQRFKTFGATIARGMGGALSRLNKALEPGDTAKRAVGNFAGDMMGRGMDAVVDAANNVRDFERNMMRFQIATDGNAASSAAFRREIAGISRDTSVSREEILAGAAAYVGFTGDADGAVKAARMFADVSIATGASVADVAQAMAALKTSMGITAADGEAAFSALIIQGKGGAVEIRDMAGQLAALAPRFALFKDGKGVRGIREMGAGFQVVMKNSATAADAATKYRAMMESLNDPKTLKALRGMGVHVKDSKGKLLDASTVFERLATSKKLFAGENLSKAFGRSEAQTAVLALREHIATYRELRDAAEDTGAVQRDKMTMLESDSGRLDKAINGLKVSIAEAFTPERITGFVNAIEGLVEKVAPLVEGIGKIGSVLGGLHGVGKSIRGALGNANNNPYGEAGIMDEAARMVASGGRVAFGDQSERARELRLRDAQNTLAKRDAYNRAVSDIMGGEKDERTTKESIRRAYLAASADPTRDGVGALGRMRAGERYLEAAGTSRKEVGAEVTKEVVAELERATKLLAEIAAKAPPVTKIGNEQVDRAASKSTDARRRVH